MRRKRKSIQKPEVVYALISKKKKSFFIAQGTKETLRETYRHNIKGRREYTQHFIESISPERPCLFILEEIDPNEQANLMLVWLRILRENGFTSFNSDCLIEYSENLYYDNEIAYQKRKNVDLSQLFDCCNCLVPTYNKVTCEGHPSYIPGINEKKAPSAPKKSGKRDIMIQWRVSDDEHETIRARAHEENMSVAACVREAALKCNVQCQRQEYENVKEHTKQLAKIRKEINRIVFTIYAQGNYHPKDIDAVVNLMQEAYQSEIELYEKMCENQSIKDV